VIRTASEYVSEWQNSFIILLWIHRKKGFADLPDNPLSVVSILWDKFRWCQYIGERCQSGEFVVIIPARGIALRRNYSLCDEYEAERKDESACCVTPIDTCTQAASWMKFGFETKIP
jgi:hypothetical protein